MGIVLILSINYFMAIMSHPKTAVESSRGLGVILVAASLALNLVQTIVDLRRGWQVSAHSRTMPCYTLDMIMIID